MIKDIFLFFGRVKRAEKLLTGHGSRLCSNHKSISGFTLVEVLMAAMVFIVAFLGILTSYIRCMELSETSKNASMALAAAKSQMETIKNYTVFNDILSTYDNVGFAVNGLTGKGVSYVQEIDTDLLKITVSVSWKQRQGRIIGEDKNLNGQIDAGEDQNSNGQLDSPVELVTYIYDKDKP